MGIESTYIIKRSDAIQMLKEKNCTVYQNDCVERLADMLYDNRESIFENYRVIEDDYEDDRTLWEECW